jgi:hypothetical protein
MGAHEEEGKPADSSRRAPRWTVALFLGFYALLSLWILLSEVYDSRHPEPDSSAEIRKDGLPRAMGAATQRQLEQLKRVDAKALTSVFFTTVESTNCTWLFQCTPPPPVVHSLSPNWDPAKGLQHFMDPKPAEPRLLYHPGWIIYLPSAQLIKGTPHALKEMAKKIWCVGGWAVAMFLSCTVIWLAAIWLAANDGKGLLIAYLMLLGSVFAISLMVTAVQSVSEYMLMKVGSVMGQLVILAPYVAAIALVFEFLHVVELWHKLIEALSVTRKEA